MKKGIIYKVTNLINSKIYIGLTTRTLNARKKEHISDALSKRFTSIFHKALIKYGFDNFQWEIICEDDIHNLPKMERYFIICCKSHYKYRKGYNLTSGGEGGNGLFGSNHFNYKQELFTFHNINGNVEQNITQHDMIRKYNLHEGSVSAIITGKLRYIKGWYLKNSSFVSKRLQYSFIHKDGTTELNVRQNYMIEKYKLSQSGISGLCKKRYVNYKNWYLFENSNLINLEKKEKLQSFKRGDLIEQNITWYNLYKKYNLNKGNIYLLSIGKTKTCSGWSLL